jgi:hypothetical protein
MRNAGQYTGPAPAMMQAGSSTQCTLGQLRGVDATVTDVHNGVAITFVAPEEEREKLRETLRDMATPRAGGPIDVFAGCACTAETAAKSAAGPGPAAPAGGARPAGGTASMQRAPMVVPAVTRETDTATGGVLVLRARTEEEGAALTTAVHEKMTAMREGCR